VLADILISDIRRFKALQQANEIAGILRLDADQDRAEIAGRLLEIFDAGDVVFRPQQVEEVAQGAGPLRKSQAEVFLEARMAHGPFLDVRQAFEIKISAGDDGYNRPAGQWLTAEHF